MRFCVWESVPPSPLPPSPSAPLPCFLSLPQLSLPLTPRSPLPSHTHRQAPQSHLPSCCCTPSPHSSSAHDVDLSCTTAGQDIRKGTGGWSADVLASVAAELRVKGQQVTCEVHERNLRYENPASFPNPEAVPNLIRNHFQTLIRSQSRPRRQSLLIGSK